MDYQDDELANQDLIHIHKVNRRGRKCQTRVVGIPEAFDYKKILKFWKNNFQTNGRLQGGKQAKQKAKKDKAQQEENEKQEEIIVINGDHREKIKQFLVYMGISDSENIRMHGAS